MEVEVSVYSDPELLSSMRLLHVVVAHGHHDAYGGDKSLSMCGMPSRSRKVLGLIATLGLSMLRLISWGYLHGVNMFCTMHKCVFTL